MRARKSTATEDFEVELTEDEHGTEMCERWADRLALARMHFARGDSLPTGDRRSGALCGPNLGALLSVALSAPAALLCIRGANRSREQPVDRALRLRHD